MATRRIPLARPEPTAKRGQIQDAVLAATEELLRRGRLVRRPQRRGIAARAGIWRTAFYFYFRDKRELLMRLTEDVTELLFAQADIWFSGDGDPERELRAALTSIAALYDEHGVLLRAIVEVSTYDEEVARFWRGLLGRFVDASAGASSASRRAAARARPSGGHRVRAVLDDRAGLLPAPRAGGAPRRDELVGALCDIWVRAVYG